MESWEIFLPLYYTGNHLNIFSYFFNWKEERWEPYSHIPAFSDLNKESNLVYTKDQDKRIKYVMLEASLDISDTLISMDVIGRSIYFFFSMLYSLQWIAGKMVTMRQLNCLFHENLIVPD